MKSGQSKLTLSVGSGYQNERVTYLNANHGNMCKFRDPGDPNYLTVKNALGSAVQNLLEDGKTVHNRYVVFIRCIETDMRSPSPGTE